MTFRKKGPRSKWTIYKHDSDKNENYMYVGSLGTLSVVPLVAARFLKLILRILRILRIDDFCQYSKPPEVKIGS